LSVNERSPAGGAGPEAGIEAGRIDSSRSRKGRGAGREVRVAVDGGEVDSLRIRKGRGAGRETRAVVDAGEGEGCAWAAHAAGPTHETCKIIVRINGQVNLSIMQTPLPSGSSVRGQDRPSPPNRRTLMINRLIAVVGIMRNAALFGQFSFG